MTSCPCLRFIKTVAQGESLFFFCAAFCFHDVVTASPQTSTYRLSSANAGFGWGERKLNKTIPNPSSQALGFASSFVGGRRPALVIFYLCFNHPSPLETAPERGALSCGVLPLLSRADKCISLGSVKTSRVNRYCTSSVPSAANQMGHFQLVVRV